MIALLALVSALLLLFELVLIARVVLDWVEVLGVSSGRAARSITGARGMLHRVTEPVLAPEAAAGAPGRDVPGPLGNRGTGCTHPGAQRAALRRSPPHLQLRHQNPGTTQPAAHEETTRAKRRGPGEGCGSRVAVHAQVAPRHGRERRVAAGEGRWGRTS